MRGGLSRGWPLKRGSTVFLHGSVYTVEIKILNKVTTNK